MGNVHLVLWRGWGGELLVFFILWTQTAGNFLILNCLLVIFIPQFKLFPDTSYPQNSKGWCFLFLNLNYNTGTSYSENSKCWYLLLWKCLGRGWIIGWLIGSSCRLITTNNFPPYNNTFPCFKPATYISLIVAFEELHIFFWQFFCGCYMELCVFKKLNVCWKI